MSVSIFGTGISGLALALGLQRAGVDCALHVAGSVDELAAGRLPKTVTRNGATVERERSLGVPLGRRRAGSGRDRLLRGGHADRLQRPVAQ
jgi:hypothetical protein